jgi:hypothetical protein
MMGVRLDTQEELRKELVTKIHGQPKEDDLTTLEKELITITASIPSMLGGGNHGHAGVIVEAAKYILMTGGTAFMNPVNPGVYPAGLLANATAGTQAREEAIHKELVAQYVIFKGVKQGLKDIIQEGVKADYLLEFEDETLGFSNQPPRQTIEEEDDTRQEHINNIEMKIQKTTKRTGNKWTRRAEERKEKRRKHKIIINSGTTSHFMSEELELPNTGPSNKDVYLPDDTKLMTANKTLLPFEQMTKAAREAEVLPGLKKSLASVNKWSEEGYTTVFHPGKKGVMVHNPGTLTMTTSKPPVLQGYKP